MQDVLVAAPGETKGREVYEQSVILVACTGCGRDVNDACRSRGQLVTSADLLTSADLRDCLIHGLVLGTDRWLAVSEVHQHKTWPRRDHPAGKCILPL